MSGLLTQLRQVLADERQALISGDWLALQSCVEHKSALAERLSELTPTPDQRDLARDLRQATLHNATLAQALSRQLSRRVERRGSAPPVYNRAGQRRVVQDHGLLRLRT